MIKLGNFAKNWLFKSIVSRTKNNILSSTNMSTTQIDAVQESYLSEPCIRVNERDEPIGQVSKLECHRNPILHRAFSVFIFDRERRMLLQKRSPTKITFPEVWTNACCSHPHFTPTESAGEAGVIRAAHRKVRHELGIERAGEMHVMGRFIYQARSDPVWVEHELDYAICVTNFAGKVEPNPEEVCEVRWVTREQLAAMFADGESNKFSPWFALFYNHKWLNIWWDHLDQPGAHKDPETIHKLN